MTDFNTTLDARIAVPHDEDLKPAKDALVKALADAGYDPHFIRLQRDPFSCPYENEACEDGGSCVYESEYCR
jgi:hypothetical protein